MWLTKEEYQNPSPKLKIVKAFNHKAHMIEQFKTISVESNIWLRKNNRDGESNEKGCIIRFGSKDRNLRILSNNIVKQPFPFKVFLNITANHFRDNEHSLI
jgi:hypothetical protein